MRRMSREGNLYESIERWENRSEGLPRQTARAIRAWKVVGEFQMPRGEEGWWCPALWWNQNALSRQSRAYVDPSNHWEINFHHGNVKVRIRKGDERIGRTEQRSLQSARRTSQHLCPHISVRATWSQGRSCFGASSEGCSVMVMSRRRTVNETRLWR